MSKIGGKSKHFLAQKPWTPWNITMRQRIYEAEREADKARARAVRHVDEIKNEKCAEYFNYKAAAGQLVAAETLPPSDIIATEHDALKFMYVRPRGSTLPERTAAVQDGGPEVAALLQALAFEVALGPPHAKHNTESSAHAPEPRCLVCHLWGHGAGDTCCMVAADEERAHRGIQIRHSADVVERFDLAISRGPSESGGVEGSANLLQLQVPSVAVQTMSVVSTILNAGIAGHGRA
jgi:hypothetical protein